jgi:hypothetical protein
MVPWNTTTVFNDARYDIERSKNYLSCLTSLLQDSWALKSVLEKGIYGLPDFSLKIIEGTTVKADGVLEEYHKSATLYNPNPHLIF